MNLLGNRLAGWLCRYRYGFGLALLYLLVWPPVVIVAEAPARPMKFEYVFDIGGRDSRFFLTV